MLVTCYRHGNPVKKGTHSCSARCSASKRMEKEMQADAASQSLRHFHEELPSTILDWAYHCTKALAAILLISSRSLACDPRAQQTIASRQEEPQGSSISIGSRPQVSETWQPNRLWPHASSSHGSMLSSGLRGKRAEASLREPA